MMISDLNEIRHRINELSDCIRETLARFSTVVTFDCCLTRFWRSGCYSAYVSQKWRDVKWSEETWLQLTSIITVFIGRPCAILDLGITISRQRFVLAGTRFGRRGSKSCAIKRRHRQRLWMRCWWKADTKKQKDMKRLRWQEIGDGDNRMWRGEKKRKGKWEKLKKIEGMKEVINGRKRRKTQTVSFDYIKLTDDTIFQPHRSGRIWHKVNFQAEFNRF